MSAAAPLLSSSFVAVTFLIDDEADFADVRRCRRCDVPIANRERRSCEQHAIEDVCPECIDEHIDTRHYGLSRWGR